MKRILLTACFVLTCLALLQAQAVYENFEGGVSSLPWIGADGTYNGVIPNPAPDAVNSSESVGSYTKGAGFSYSLFLAEVLSPLDIREFNQFTLKVWCDVATPVLLKLEGPGASIEKTAEMAVAGAWNELHFDLSGGAGLTTLNKIIIFFDPGVDASSHTYYFDDLIAYGSEQCYDDFESGSSNINWQGLDGLYEGIVDNPEPNKVNESAFCAKYTKSNQHAYSLLLGDVPENLDLSVNNQFKIQVYAGAATQVLMKLEGPNGGIERTRNIAVVNAWQEYTFDFSAAAGETSYNKIILFFDPGVENSGDTYYFDNLCAVPQGVCTGVTPDPLIIDDFECQRNATYALGWDSLEVVTNPYVTFDNLSRSVGKVNDAAGPGTEYYPLVIDYQNPLDLSVNNQFSVQVYSHKAGTLLLKIEGGQGPKEVPFEMEENTWATYTLDCSDQAGRGHKRFVMFFNAGVNGEDGDVYYIDNITIGPKSEPDALEDFEGGVHLGWQPLDQNTVIHGDFEAPVDNPAPGGVNTSAEVGCYTKGVSPFSTLQAFLPENLDLTDFSQLNIDVLAPAGAERVVMQLNSASQGNKEAEARVDGDGTWETLSFDFSAFTGITDFGEIRLLFQPGTDAAGQRWCVDNLNQSTTTVDPCEDVLPITNIIDDFECQRNYAAVFYGASDLSVVNNPHITADNSSLKVGRYEDPANEPYAGIGFEFEQAPDLEIFNQLQVQVWSDRADVPFLFKLQTGGQQVEIFDTLRNANSWNKFNIDFSPYLGTTNTQLVIFFNVGSDEGGLFFVDNIRWARQGINGCAINYETPATTISNFRYFANGALEAAGYQFEVVDNPHPSTINTSSKVGKFVKAGDAQPFAGMYADLDAALDWKGVKQIRAKVHMDHIGNFAVKLEGDAVNGFVIETPIANTVVNGWEELVFDFSVVPDNSEFKRLTLFFDLTIDATGTDVASYFDDIVVGDGSCATNSIFKPLLLETLSVAPNPVQYDLMIDNTGRIGRIDVMNMLGARIASVRTLGESRTAIDVSRLPGGVYTLVGYGIKGEAVGMAKFVKQ